jgi:hypothetical protein
LQCRGYDRINDRSGFSQGKNMNENTWQQMLVDSFPKPFVRGFRGVPFSAGYPSCRDGWQDIVIRLVERVEAALRCRHRSEALRGCRPSANIVRLRDENTLEFERWYAEDER